MEGKDEHSCYCSVRLFATRKKLWLPISSSKKGVGRVDSMNHHLIMGSFYNFGRRFRSPKREQNCEIRHAIILKAGVGHGFLNQ